MPVTIEGVKLLYNTLLAAGLTGCKSSELNYALRNTPMRKEDIDAVLLEWRSKQFINVYKTSSRKGKGGRPATVYQATKLLAEHNLFNGMEK